MHQCTHKIEWETAISDSRSDDVIVRGYSLTDDLIGKIGFASMLYLLFKGELPDQNASKMIDALLISCADHGVVPSSAVTRVVQSSGVPIQSSVAAGILTIGDVHGGAGEEFSRLLQQLVSDTVARKEEFSAAAVRFVRERRRVDGFGHPLHPEGDPRSGVLLGLAKELNVAGDHIRMTEEIGKAIEAKSGRRIHLNIDGAVGAIISDLGFDWRFARPFIFIPRSVGLSAHAVEEQVRGRGARHLDSSRISYDGVARRTSAASGRL